MRWIKAIPSAARGLLPVLLLATGPLFAFGLSPEFERSPDMQDIAISSLWIDAVVPASSIHAVSQKRESEDGVERDHTLDIGEGGQDEQRPGGLAGNRATIALSSGSGNPEVVVTGPAAQSDDAIAAFADLGAPLLRRRTLGTLGLEILTFEYPRPRSLTLAIQALNEAAPQMTAAYQNLYRFSQFRPRTYAAQMIAADPVAGCRLPRSIRVGMIDGPVDPSHPALKDADITTLSLLRDRERPAPASHGTAIAGLIVGEDPNGLISGFAQGADLVAINIFSRRWGRERADVERIATAIDLLLARGVRLINMSFSGPDNPVLRIVLDAAAARRAVMIGAVGNTGDDSVTLPSAAESVIGVTAVDARARRFWAANVGPSVEFSAPGVEVFAARSRRGGYVTGTSFAAPIVTALTASLMARGVASLPLVRSALRASTYDLGPVGRDPEFGWGLVRARGC